MMQVSAAERGIGSTKSTATEVTIGQDTVAFKRSGQTSVVIAKILGRSRKRNAETIWLDRLVHEDDEEFVGCSASGAISTVLSVNVESLQAT